MHLLLRCFYLKTSRVEDCHMPRSVLVIPYHPFVKNVTFFNGCVCPDSVSNKWIIRYEKSHLHLAVTNHVGSLFNHAMVPFDLLATARMQSFT